MLQLALAAALVVIGEAPQVVIEKPPHWLQTPTGENVMGVYPPGAARFGTGGQAELECQVDQDGRLRRCQVFAEWPVGQGFGSAALALTSKFRLEVPAEGRSTVAPTIYIPIRFRVTPPGSFPKGSVVVAPRWASAPSFEDVAAAFPKSARVATGSAVFACKVQSDGALGSCDEIEEKPANEGFGAAARALMNRFRLDLGRRPSRVDDALVVAVKVDFKNPASDEIRQRRIKGPVWLKLFGESDVAVHFPPAAAAKGLTSGRGVASCVVAPDGRLRDCVPAPADPEGFGFSEAAVDLVSDARMNPWTQGGGPVNGARVLLPIPFQALARKR